MKASGGDQEIYETPAWAVRRLLEALPLEQSIFDGPWFDPCVGEGAIQAAVEAHGYSKAWVCNDIRDTRYLNNHFDVGGIASITDYCDLGRPWPRFSVAIFNPPFSLAHDFVRKAVGHCHQVFMLQRLSWMQSPERAEFLRENPFDLFVLPERPSFTGDGKTDSAGYAWYSWPRQGRGVVILDSTPLDERRTPAAISEAA